MFPPSVISSVNYYPMSYHLFMQSIAIPHAAMILIAEDLNISALDEALDVMWESCQYGNIVHPGDDNDEELQDALEACHLARQKEKRTALSQVRMMGRSLNHMYIN